MLPLPSIFFYPQRTSTSSREDRSTLDAPSSNANSGPSSLFQRGKPWLEDGNVILVAEHTSFRVHKSILSRHSEFFHDMFKLPQPPHPEGDEAAAADEKCPTIQTSESAQDLSHFLGAMYNSITFVLFPYVSSQRFPPRC